MRIYVHVCTWHINIYTRIYTYKHTIYMCDICVYMCDIRIYIHVCVWHIQHAATHCNTLQHTATHCNTLQHAATHDNTVCMAHMCVCTRICVCAHTSVFPILQTKTSRRLQPYIHECACVCILLR